MSSTTHWESEQVTGHRRVLYVGASRAQRLLIFATPKEQADRIAKLLKAGNVPHTPMTC